jgi:hypothetical protein
MEFLDISSTNDSSLLIQAIQNPDSTPVLKIHTKNLRIKQNFSLFKKSIL